ncbi:MAG TPA: glycosyltransferase family 2 protein [Candidatus Acidoferrales bacterium]|nr:glycosyltransferase family 2 protein [Candidatus Acidoferrales bacterium]
MRIAAVSVNWNQGELTRLCVASLIAGSRIPDWVIVVDNGSDQDPTAAVKLASPETIVVRNSHNQGFAGGSNRGIERALSLGADAVLLVNNDALVAEGCLQELLAVLSSDDSLAAVGAKTLTQESPPRIHTAYGVLTYHGQLVQQRGWMEPDLSRYNELAYVDYVSGCAMLLRRSALETVGMFDEEFFAYHEDLDWCMRARRGGYRVAYVPRALVHHRMHASTGGGYLSPITYLSARNSVLFVRKNATRSQQMSYAIHLIVNLVKEGIFRYRRGELAGFRLRLRGLRDGLLRRPVPLRTLGLESHAAAPSARASQPDASTAPA